MSSASTHWFCLSCNCSKRLTEMKIKTDNHQGICKTHYNKGARMSDYESSSSQQHQQPIFDKSSEHHRISIPQRYTIIILHLPHIHIYIFHTYTYISSYIFHTYILSYILHTYTHTSILS